MRIAEVRAQVRSPRQGAERQPAVSKPFHSRRPQPSRQEEIGLWNVPRASPNPKSAELTPTTCSTRGCSRILLGGERVVNRKGENWRNLQYYQAVKGKLLRLLLPISDRDWGTIQPLKFGGKRRHPGPAPGSSGAGPGAVRLAGLVATSCSTRRWFR